MSLPQNATPSANSDPAVPPKTQDPAVPPKAEPEPVVVPDPEEVVLAEDASEDASDAALRTWARDNNIDGVPANGKLSASWRDQITKAMASDLNDMSAALDPKEEGSVVDTSSPESSISVEKKTTLTDGEETSSPTEEELVEEEKAEEPVAPEFETGTYRSVFKAPNTFVTGQAFTA